MEFLKQYNMEQKKQIVGFLGVLLAHFVTSLVEPVISTVVNGINGKVSRKTGRGYMDKKILVLLYIEITNYFNYETKFNGALSRNNLPRIKEGAYVTNLDDKKSKTTHWVSSFVDRNAAVYFDSFGKEYIRNKVLNKMRDKYIIHNMFRIQNN